MTIEEAIKHADEEAKEQDKLCKRYDDASGYSRSHNEAIRTTDAKRCEECAEEHRQLAKWLKELKKLREQTRWIPVSEKLPKEHLCDDEYVEPSDYVLVQMKSGLMHVARYWIRLDSRWLGIPDPTTDKVVAWMPLPKPYEPQESEG